MAGFWEWVHYMGDVLQREKAKPGKRSRQAVALLPPALWKEDMRRCRRGLDRHSHWKGWSVGSMPSQHGGAEMMAFLPLGPISAAELLAGRVCVCY